MKQLLPLLQVNKTTTKIEGEGKERKGEERRGERDEIIVLQIGTLALQILFEL